MAVYTCYEMVADCRANKPEGWVHFVKEYVPIIRALLAHYHAARGSGRELLTRVITAVAKPDSDLFRDRPSSPEREFVTHLRQAVLRAVEVDQASRQAEIPLDLEIMTKALEEFTALERQMVWMLTMRYDGGSTGTIMRMEPKTVDQARERAKESLRRNMDHWNQDILEANGNALSVEAAGVTTKDCIPVRSFLDLLDGKMTWRLKQDIETHMTACWHCVDHLCRIREVDELLSHNTPLTPEEAAPYLNLLGAAEEKKPFWKRVLAR